VQLSQHDHAELSVSLCADALTRDLPRDQALGLRLLALARAAAGIHMAHLAMATPGAGIDDMAQEPEGLTQFVRTQAAGLLDGRPNPGEPLP
jgi:hypothetical protein